MDPQNLRNLLASLSNADGDLSIEKCAAALVRYDTGEAATTQPVKIRCIKASGEFYDGCTYTIYSPKEIGGLVDLIESWRSDGEVGDAGTLEIVELTQEEIDALPEV
jgi:hypothetical protein